MAYLDMVFSSEVKSAGVLLKLVASNVIMVAFTTRAFEILMISGGKVRGVASNLEHSSNFMIIRKL